MSEESINPEDIQIESEPSAPLVWEETELHSNVMSRISGVTKEKFSADVAMWEMGVKALDSYNESVLRQEVTTMDFSIPGEHNFDTAALFACYSKLTSYRERLGSMMAKVKKQETIFAAAEDALEKAAKGLFNSGTIKDKEAAAAFVVHPFTMALAKTKAFSAWLEQWLKALEFNSKQIEIYLKERQDERRVNWSFKQEGDSVNYENMQSNNPSYGRTRRTYGAAKQDQQD